MNVASSNDSIISPIPPSPLPTTSVASTEGKSPASMSCLTVDQRAVASQTPSIDQNRRKSCPIPQDASKGLQRESFQAPWHSSSDVPRTNNTPVNMDSVSYLSTLPSTQEHASFRAAVEARSALRQWDLKPRFIAMPNSDRVTGPLMATQNHQNAEYLENSTLRGHSLSAPSSPSASIPLQSPSLFESMRIWAAIEGQSTCCCDGHGGCEEQDALYQTSAVHATNSSTAPTSKASPSATPPCDHQYHYFSSGCKHVKDNVYGADPWTLPLGQGAARPIWDGIANSGIESGLNPMFQQPPNATGLSPSRYGRSLQDLFVSDKGREKDGSKGKGKEMHPLETVVSKSETAALSDKCISPPPAPIHNAGGVHSQHPPSSLISVLTPRKMIKSSWIVSRRRQSYHAGSTYDYVWPDTQSHGGRSRHLHSTVTERSWKTKSDDVDTVHGVVERWKRWHQKHF
ncbi:hypothetical protein BGZ73_009243 [Actinomortierella ambigua]|nr:hypothetical protein BGZ73_009243 [Actinomortierella ambigua]